MFCAADCFVSCYGMLVDKAACHVVQKSGYSGKRRRIRSVEDIANAFTSGEGPPRAIRLTSPRSLLACLQTGIDPSELQYRPFEEFAEQSYTRELQQVKYEYYEKKRKGVMAPLPCSVAPNY
ncbi:hypothetical protein CBR_g2742 [Chara braunii]|uniref:Uncharacterized protein n=1 Tax=Chara braunii TaxID=69332 RepID=A0A388KDQ3_CHABU|nr:hypothetical protein CBR_g2742 [Chara braunii]|eukprot:GBG68190.1 hypothetical protein CBR_g2742 [Chara braunii]